MTRLIRLIFLIILLLIVSFIAYFWVMRISIAERFLSKQLNTKVLVKDIKVSWNHLILEDLNIQGGGNAYTFEGTIELRGNPLSLFRFPIRLKSVEIRNPIMTLELYNGIGSDNSWSRLISLLPTHGEHKLIIDSLVIDNLRFEIKRPNGKNVTVAPIEHLEFKNVGEKTALTVPQILKLIFQTILSNLKDKPHLGAILDNVAPLPPYILNGTTSSVPYKEDPKGMLSEKVEKLKRKTQEAAEFLHELFSN